MILYTNSLVAIITHVFYLDIHLVATQQYNFVNIVLPSEFSQNLDETEMQFFDKKLIEGRMTQVW